MRCQHSRTLSMHVPRAQSAFAKGRSEPSFVALTCRGTLGLTLCSVSCGPTLTGQTRVGTRRGRSWMN
jgi:hypothetical protein